MHGAVAGLAGSIVQAAIGYLIDRAFLPRGYNNNIAPRLFSRRFQRSGQAPHPVRDWLGGSIFHQLYGWTGASSRQWRPIASACRRPCSRRR